MGFGWTETLLIFGIILLVFGPKQLPKLARNLGSSINVFKEEINKTTEGLEDGVPSEPLENEAAGIDLDQTEVPSEDRSTENDNAEN